MSSPSRQVLLVEDDADVREALATVLRRCGYEVASACNGRDAIDHLARTEVEPVLIVLDWVMPVMSGLEFLTYQAADPGLRSIPVLILSAVDRVIDLVGGNVAAVLTKPVRMKTLVDVIDRLCDMPRRPAGFLEARATGRVPLRNVTPPPPPPPTIAFKKKL